MVFNQKLASHKSSKSWGRINFFSNFVSAVFFLNSTERFNQEIFCCKKKTIQNANVKDSTRPWTTQNVKVTTAVWLKINVDDYQLPALMNFEVSEKKSDATLNQPKMGDILNRGISTIMMDVQGWNRSTNGKLPSRKRLGPWTLTYILGDLRFGSFPRVKFTGCCSLPVTVTTRIITFLIGNPGKPSFPTVTVRRPHPNYESNLPLCIIWKSSHFKMFRGLMICLIFWGNPPYSPQSYHGSRNSQVAANWRPSAAILLAPALLFERFG